MRFLLLLFITSFSIRLQAQQLAGIVVDDTSGNPLAGVLVKNNNSGITTTSGPSGRYLLAVRKGDVIRFSLLGYTVKELFIMSDATELYERIPLSKRAVAMDTVVVLPGLSRYQEDSLARREIYGKKVDEKPAKFKFNKPHPLYGGLSSYNAPISSLIQKKTKKYKRLKAFQDRFRANEQQLFIDTRYTPSLVQELTGLQGDSLLLFMKRYPMAYDFARSAGDVELMMWIKYNYRQSKAVTEAKKQRN